MRNKTTILLSLLVIFVFIFLMQKESNCVNNKSLELDYLKISIDAKYLVFNTLGDYFDGNASAEGTLDSLSINCLSSAVLSNHSRASEKSYVLIEGQEGFYLMRFSHSSKGEQSFLSVLEVKGDNKVAGSGRIYSLDCNFHSIFR